MGAEHGGDIGPLKKIPNKDVQAGMPGFDVAETSDINLYNGSEALEGVLALEENENTAGIQIVPEQPEKKHSNKKKGKWNKLTDKIKAVALTRELERQFDAMDRVKELGLIDEEAEAYKANQEEMSDIELNHIALDVYMKAKRKELAEKRKNDFEKTKIGKLIAKGLDFWSRAIENKDTSAVATALDAGMVGAQVASLGAIGQLIHPSEIGYRIATRMAVVTGFKKISDLAVRKLAKTKLGEKAYNLLNKKDGELADEAVLKQRIQNLQYAAIGAGTAIVAALAGVAAALGTGISLFTREKYSNFYKRKIDKIEKDIDVLKELLLKRDGFEGFIKALKKADSKMGLLLNNRDDLEYIRETGKAFLTVIAGIASFGIPVDSMFAHISSSRRLATEPVSAFTKQVKETTKIERNQSKEADGEPKEL